MKKTKLFKGIIYLSIAILVGITIGISRIPQISSALRDIIVPELEDISGQKVTIENISLNIFPVFIEAKGLNVSSREGAAVLYARQVKAYVSLSGIVRRRITIRRLVISEPDITADRKQIEEIIKNVQEYLAKERDSAIKVKIKVIEIVKGNMYLSDGDLKGTLKGKGFSGELIIGEKQNVKASVKELHIHKEDWPKIICDVNTSLIIQKEKIEINRLEVGSLGSKFKGEGVYAKGHGNLKTRIALIIDSVKRMFNLEQKGDGSIAVTGEVRIEKSQQPTEKNQILKDIFVDLKLSGDFYIQTLMELLKVKEKIEGLFDFKGEITGRLSDISANAKARLRSGNIYGVDIDSLTCQVLYKDGIMQFKNGFAMLYNGTAQADASINLPVVNNFTLNVKFNSADSKGLFKLIGWDPGIPLGKVDGELSASGSEFHPDGWFVYKSLSAEQASAVKGYQPPTDNILNRIKEIKGYYSLQKHILNLSNIKLNTLQSGGTVNGLIDTEKKSLNLKSTLYTENLSDLTLPYYREIKGKGEFSGEVSGTFDDPKISGKLTSSNLFIEGYQSDTAATNFSYQKNLLDIREAVFRSTGEEHVIKGKISFTEAKELFDLSKPVYNLNVSLKNAEFGKAVQIFYKDFLGKGRMNADIKMGGKDKDIDISGKAFIEKASIYRIPIDSGSGAFTYEHKEFSLKQVKITKGQSVLTGEGKLLQNDRFSYKASSDKLFVKDIGQYGIPDDCIVSLQSEGHGAFDNPAITLHAKVIGGSFKGRDMGGGSISAVIQNKDISVNASLCDDKMKLKGTGYLDEKIPWSAELSILPGRYDFLVSSFLKDVPEDLQLNLEGRIDLKGDRNNIAASANIKYLALSLFGQTFSNDSQINFQLQNRKLSLIAFVLKSGATSFRLQGGLELGKEYDLLLDGSSSLAPLKGLTKKIGYLKGNTDFVFSVRGKWEKPEINGGMNIAEASLGFRDYPTYISSINGYLYVDADKIVLHKLSGKLGGGNINITGIVYLKAFSFKRFYLEASLDNIPTTLAKDFTVNFNGNLLYKGTLDAQSMTGDIKINRAFYKQMVEWRSWLLKPKAKEKLQAEASIFEKAELNVRISGSENISIDNNVARAPVSISGDMIVKGTISNPILFGRIESKEGYVYFRNNEFRIIFASVDFADPNRIKPVVNLTAETNVKGYDIRLSLEGMTDHFNLALSSDPHLEEMDILSLLTVGQVGKELKGVAGGVGAGEATSFITGKVQDVVEERLRTLTGLDRFQVESSYSTTTGTVNPKVTVSKRLIGDKLFVTYSNVLSSELEQILKVEYLLDKHISLIGVRDEIGSVGGDIKFRFEFK